MIEIRKSEDRGRTLTEWLDSRHTFSFGDYLDRNWMSFRTLRVLNDDVIQPGSGFGEHPHRDMEIITWVLKGGLKHKDSLGNGSELRHGDTQVMSAGSGIFHSEFNASQTEPGHFIQTWIFPREKNITPRYEEKHFPIENRLNQWCLIASPDENNGSLLINQDAWLYVSTLEQNQKIDKNLNGLHAYLHVARGKVLVNGTHMNGGDGAKINDEETITISSFEPSELLLFELK
jgi:redox-sensitive bicupin YhaK (pirin superfamily)